MNIFRALMAQHDRIEGPSADLCKACEHQEHSAKKILDELSGELRRHFELEEQLFYATVAPSLILVNASRFLAEHQNLLGMLQKIESESTTDSWFQEVKAFENDLVRHAGDEEIELFPEVKRRFDRGTLEGMGEMFQRIAIGEISWKAVLSGS